MKNAQPVSLRLILLYFHSCAMSQTVPTFQEEIEPGRVLTMPADGSGVTVLDPWLEPYKDALRSR